MDKPNVRLQLVFSESLSTIIAQNRDGSSRQPSLLHLQFYISLTFAVNIVSAKGGRLLKYFVTKLALKFGFYVIPVNVTQKSDLCWEFFRTKFTLFLKFSCVGLFVMVGQSLFLGERFVTDGAIQVQLCNINPKSKALCDYMEVKMLFESFAAFSGCRTQLHTLP